MPDFTQLNTQPNTIGFAPITSSSPIIRTFIQQVPITNPLVQAPIFQYQLLTPFTSFVPLDSTSMYNMNQPSNVLQQSNRQNSLTTAATYNGLQSTGFQPIGTTFQPQLNLNHANDFVNNLIKSTKKTTSQQKSTQQSANKRRSSDQKKSINSHEGEYDELSAVLARNH